MRKTIRPGKRVSRFSPAAPPGRSLSPERVAHPHLSRRAIALVCVIVLTLAAIGADVFHLGFFADDFHFLDVARRLPLLDLLSGQHGMWPYYRPLSREVYFEVIVAAGPAALPLARSVSLLAVLGIAWLTWRIGLALFQPSAAAVAVCLVLTYNYTKFLTAWASGFQDLLALLLILSAVAAHLADRRWSLLPAALAPFAKETGFLAFGLLALLEIIRPAAPRLRLWWSCLVLLLCLDAGLHALVRLAWTPGAGAPHPALEPGRLATILEEMFTGFVSTSFPVDARSVALAIVAAAAAALLLLRASRQPHTRQDPGARLAMKPALVFTAAAALLGVMPVVSGHLLTVTYAHAYHTFPALPWNALMLGLLISRLPRRIWMAAVPLLVLWNVIGLGLRGPDLEDRRSWAFRRWDWRDALRFDAVTRRLATDVRLLLPVRPESLVVLYESMPYSAFFQTEDGPATREVLEDRTVRAFWVSEPPMDIERGRLAILVFDTASLHMTHPRWSDSTAIARAANAIIAGRAPAARAFLLCAESPVSSSYDLVYLDAAVTLLTRGPSAYARHLEAAGLADTLGTQPRGPAAAHDFGAGVDQAFAAMLRRPLTAAAHADLADSLLSRGALRPAALELRIALSLSPREHPLRYGLALTMYQLGGQEEAEEEFQMLAADSTAGRYREAARHGLSLLRDQAAPSR